MTTYTHRYLARLIIEAETPLSVGSGVKNIMTDSVLAKDVNGLPYIPGTAIAGVVRSMLAQIYTDTDEKFRTEIEKLFGYHETKEQKDKRKAADENDTEDLSKGSDVMFTDAKILKSSKEVVDGLVLDAFKDDLLKSYKTLPIRQHARINNKGVTEKRGKFDEEICFAGTRFCFEIETVSTGDNYKMFENIIKQFYNRTFRIGSGTRSGFGEISVKEYYSKDINLKDKLDLYLKKSSNLTESAKWAGWQKQSQNSDMDNWTEYILSIEPNDSFLFGSGMGDDDADMTPVKAAKVDWEKGKGELVENLVLIPATSIKGALSHRTAFYFNKEVGNTADKLKNLNKEDKGKRIKEFTLKNPAVMSLFGYEGDKNDNNEIVNQKRGNVIISDCIQHKQTDEKILNHVSIDRFTGGAIDGALFYEKTTYVTDSNKIFEIKILVYNEVLKDETIKLSFEKAMKDVCCGMLPLGGGVNRGHGIFSGTLTENGNIIYPNDKRGGLNHEN